MGRVTAAFLSVDAKAVTPAVSYYQFPLHVHSRTGALISAQNEPSWMIGSPTSSPASPVASAKLTAAQVRALPPTAVQVCNACH
jgi:hypothetical protein